MTESGHSLGHSKAKLIAWIIITLVLILLTIWISRAKIKAIEYQQKRWSEWVCQRDYRHNTNGSDRHC